uniref:Uncharacterized protein n=1 Tax=Rhizophora mucronata TaxID=61149 RepID=A0A2P2NVK1_RHIMU
MAETFGSFLAKDTSIGPPDIKTNMVGPLEAKATLDTKSCWRPGKRSPSLSLNSASTDWSRPITRTVASARPAAPIAPLNSWSSAQPTSAQPGS